MTNTCLLKTLHKCRQTYTEPTVHTDSPTGGSGERTPTVGTDRSLCVYACRATLTEVSRGEWWLNQKKTLPQALAPSQHADDASRELTIFPQNHLSTKDPIIFLILYKVVNNKLFVFQVFLVDNYQMHFWSDFSYSCCCTCCVFSLFFEVLLLKNKTKKTKIRSSMEFEYFCQVPSKCFNQWFFKEEIIIDLLTK